MPCSALESLLTSLANIFESELALLVSRTDKLVHDLAEDITREELNRLLGLRGAVGECLGRTIGIRRAIDRLLSEGSSRVTRAVRFVINLIVVVAVDLERSRRRSCSRLLDGQGKRDAEKNFGS